MGCKVWRPAREGRLVISMPFTPGNRRWLKQELGARIRPEYLGQGKWSLARNHFERIVEAMRDRFGRVDVYIDFTETQRCDVRCQQARSRECDCTCLGENHGGGITHGWTLVGDSTLVMSSGVKRRHLVVLREDPAPRPGR